jgi:acyl carrier protein
MTAITRPASLIQEISEIVRRAAKIPPPIAIDANSQLVEDLAIDSIDLVGVILEIQDHFDIVIEDEAVPHLCRIADLAAYLAARYESNRF